MWPDGRADLGLHTDCDRFDSSDDPPGCSFGKRQTQRSLLHSRRREKPVCPERFARGHAVPGFHSTSSAAAAPSESRLLFRPDRRPTRVHADHDPCGSGRESSESRAENTTPAHTSGMGHLYQQRYKSFPMSGHQEWGIGPPVRHPERRRNPLCHSGPRTARMTGMPMPDRRASDRLVMRFGKNPGGSFPTARSPGSRCP